MNHARANVNNASGAAGGCANDPRQRQRPRMTVFRSHKHMYVQVIDDQDGRTLAAASTVDKDVRGDLKYGGNKAAAEPSARRSPSGPWPPESSKWLSTAALPVSWTRGRPGRRGPQSRI